MAIFKVEMSDGFPITISCIDNAAEAAKKAEDQVNRYWQGNAGNAARRAAINGAECGLYADGEYLVRVNPVKALSVQAMLEVWSAGAGCYVNIPA